MSSQGVKRFCPLLDPKEFECVFDTQEAALRVIGEDFSPIRIARYSYFLNDNASYFPGRTAAELMYQCLFEPSTFNNPLVHGRTHFQYVGVSSEGYFRANPKPKDFSRLTEMPKIEDMLEVLKEADILGEDVRHPKLVKFINEVLRGKGSNADETFKRILSA